MYQGPGRDASAAHEVNPTVPSFGLTLREQERLVSAAQRDAFMKALADTSSGDSTHMKLKLAEGIVATSVDPAAALSSVQGQSVLLG
eukprot:3976975-Pyramimonas_sp.AAC.1